MKIGSKKIKSMVTMLGVVMLLAFQVKAIPLEDSLVKTQPYEVTFVEAIKEISVKFEVFFTFDLNLVEGIMVEDTFRELKTVENAVEYVLQETTLKYRIIQAQYVIIYKDDAEGIESLRQMSHHMDGLISEGEKAIIKEPKRREIAVSRLAPRQLNRSVAPIAFSVEGAVTDQEGEPLIGVNIQVKGTNKGTATDFEGKFILEDIDENAVLVVSYVGYQTQEVPVAGKSNLDITLTSDSQLLDEVVVVGYGTQKKVNLTGAVGTASGDVLEDRAIANVAEGLQGVIPNLNIAPRNGDPTTPIEYNVRGFESINGGAPLVLVDGVPMDLNRIDPSSIENISVLKDASAAAVYGARAAFGVILVETKDGSDSDKGLNIAFNTLWSVGTPILNVDPVTDPYEYVQLMNAASIRTSGQPAYDDDYVEKTKAWSENPETADTWGVKEGVLRYYGNSNYKDKVFRNSTPSNKHNLEFSGSSDDINYYMSLGYYNKAGWWNFNNDKFSRYNILSKIDFKVSDWLTLDEKIVLNSEKSDKPHEYIYSLLNYNTIIRQPGKDPLQFPDLEYYLTPGDKEKYAPYIGMYYGDANVIPYLKDGSNTLVNNNDMWLTTGATLQFLDNIKIRGEFSYNRYSEEFNDVATKVDLLSTFDLTSSAPLTNGYSGTDFIDEKHINNQYYVINIYGDYSIDINKHFLKAMIGFNQEWSKNKAIRALAYGIITNKVQDINSTTGNQETFGGSSHFALRGGFYRLNYNFDERYLLEFNGRYDGSSRFPTNSRFDFFPSFSAGWRISEENFMASLSNVIDNFKVRASYGQLGNQVFRDNYYPYISTLNVGVSRYLLANSKIPYVAAPGLVSPTLTWETVVNKNIGIDIGLFNYKIDLSFDLYSRETQNMLMNVEYPSILGTNAPKENAADLETKGWELSLGWNDKIGSGFNYNLSVALSDWKSTITKYNNPSGALSEYYVGKNIGEIWGYETVGIFQTKEEVEQSADQSRLGTNWRPGDIRYNDLNNDGIISPGDNTLNNPGDRKVIGNTTPRYSFGLNGGVGYKNFSISFFFQGVLKREYWPPTGNWTWFFPFSSRYAEKFFYEDSWREDNRDAYFPALHQAWNTTKNKVQQSRFIQNAAYIRFKNLSISYSLPKPILDNIGISKVQIYFTGMNLWEASPIRHPLDPETIYYHEMEYPMQRSYSLGLRINY